MHQHWMCNKIAMECKTE